MAELIIERIKQNLNQLGLSMASQTIENSLREAEKSEISYTEFLDKLLEEELIAKEDKKIKTLLKLAGFPSLKRIEEFDFGYQPTISKARIKELAELGFIKQAENIIFLGPPGVGKTHLAIGLGIKAIEKGFKVYFTTLNKLIKEIIRQNKDGKDRMGFYLRVSVLIIDEIGYLPLDKEGANIFFQVISARYERAPIIITSNKSFKEWGEITAQDSVLAGAILDRLLHHAHVFNIQGRSYRLKGKIELTK